MRSVSLQDLAVLSLTDPRAAARRILGAELSMAARWQVVALMSVLTAAITAGSLMLAPPDMPIPMFFANPLLMAAFVAVTMIGVAYASAAFAPAVGGRGRWEDVLILLAWVQALRVVAQLALAVLGLVPAGAALGAILGLIVSVAGVWVSVMFVTEALRLSTPWKGLLLLTVAGVAVILVLSIVWAVIGPVPEGLSDV